MAMDNNLRDERIVCEADKGIQIYDAVRDALLLSARLKMPVHLVFSQKTVVCNFDKSVCDVVHRWQNNDAA